MRCGIQVHPLTSYLNHQQILHLTMNFFSASPSLDGDDGDSTYTPESASTPNDTPRGKSKRKSNKGRILQRWDREYSQHPPACLFSALTFQ